MKKIKAVVFDADGMMILGERPSLRLARDYGVPMEKISAFFDNEFKACIVGKSDLKEVLLPYLKEWGWKGTLDEFLHFWFAESYEVDQRMRRAAQDLRAKGIKCLLATNQEKYRVAYMKKEMGLGELFDGVLASSDIGIKKPETGFFDALMELLPGVQKDEVLFWDDRKETIDAAKRYGFQAIRYLSFNHFCTKMDIST